MPQVRALRLLLRGLRKVLTSISFLRRRALLTGAPGRLLNLVFQKGVG